MAVLGIIGAAIICYAAVTGLVHLLHRRGRPSQSRYDLNDFR